MLIISKKDFRRLIRKIGGKKDITDLINQKIFFRDQTTMMWYEMGGIDGRVFRFTNPTIISIFSNYSNFEIGLEVFDNLEESYRITIHKRKDL